eukprot:3284716-Rhodomonas_salina.4
MRAVTHCPSHRDWHVTTLRASRASAAAVRARGVSLRPEVLVRTAHGVPTVLASSTAHGAPTVLVSTAHGVPTVLVSTAHGVPTVLVSTAHGVPTVLVSTAHGVPTVLASAALAPGANYYRSRCLSRYRARTGRESLRLYRTRCTDTSWQYCIRCVCTAHSVPRAHRTHQRHALLQLRTA